MCITCKKAKAQQYNDDFDCIDCHTNTGEIGEYYMVRKNVWKLANLGPDDGMLCIGCLEKRIGRKLTHWDFPDIPVNDPLLFKQSKRLQNRLNS